MSQEDQDGNESIANEAATIAEAFETAATGCRNESALTAIIMILGGYAYDCGLCVDHSGELFVNIANSALVHRQHLIDTEAQAEAPEGRPN